MEKEFISYNLVLELKKLGFDEKCLSYSTSNTDASGRTWTSVIVAPLYQQAFRWFREKYNFISEINVYSTSDGYSFSFKILCKKYTPYIEANNAWLLYEEAELECLKKLIEIAKEQK
jgi:hypothetical protein